MSPDAAANVRPSESQAGDICVTGLKGDRWHHVVREPPSIEGRMCGSQGMTGTVTHAAPLFIKSFSCLSSHLLRSVSAVRHWSDLPFSFSGLMSVARHEVCPSVSPDPFSLSHSFLSQLLWEHKPPVSMAATTRCPDCTREEDGTYAALH